MKKILPLLLLTTTVCAETHLALPTGNAAGNDTQISDALMQQATDNVAPASTPSNLSEAEPKKIFEEAKTAFFQENYARGYGAHWPYVQKRRRGRQGLRQRQTVV